MSQKLSKLQAAEAELDDLYIEFVAAQRLRRPAQTCPPPPPVSGGSALPGALPSMPVRSELTGHVAKKYRGFTKGMARHLPRAPCLAQHAFKSRRTPPD